MKSYTIDLEPKIRTAEENLILLYKMKQLFLFARLTFRSGVPNLGYMYPQGYICLSKGVYLGLAIEDRNIFTYYLFPIFMHISV